MAYLPTCSLFVHICTIPGVWKNKVLYSLLKWSTVFNSPNNNGFSPLAKPKGGRGCNFSHPFAKKCKAICQRETTLLSQVCHSPSSELFKYECCPSTLHYLQWNAHLEAYMNLHHHPHAKCWLGEVNEAASTTHKFRQHYLVISFLSSPSV